MQSGKKALILFRVILVLIGVGIITTGATYAALQSPQASLTGNSIESATADLRIGTSASSFAASRTGFTFSNIVPGGSAMPADGNSFYLKNYGTAALNLKMAISTTPVNTNNVDLTKVFIVITRVDTATTQTFSVTNLVSSYASGGVAFTDSLASGAVAQYKASVSMAADAFSGTSATVSGIDLSFLGTATAN